MIKIDLDDDDDDDDDDEDEGNEYMYKYECKYKYECMSMSICIWVWVYVFGASNMCICKLMHSIHWTIIISNQSKQAVKAKSHLFMLFIRMYKYYH